jgi:hypothetical protein
MTENRHFFLQNLTFKIMYGYRSGFVRDSEANFVLDSNKLTSYKEKTRAPLGRALYAGKCF